MSAETLRRIGSDFAARVANLDRVDDPMGLLVDFMTALSRDIAETVFTTVQAQPGWTQGEAQALADQSLHEHILIIADTMHAYGGTVEMAQDLARVSAIAYGTRLAELSSACGHGGAA